MRLEFPPTPEVAAIPCPGCGRAPLHPLTRPQLCGWCPHRREKAQEYLDELRAAGRERGGA